MNYHYQQITVQEAKKSWMKSQTSAFWMCAHGRIGLRAYQSGNLPSQ